MDGSGGTCDSGYQLGSQSLLSNGIFGGKTYKHAVSSNCCIFNADPVENFGFDFSSSGTGGCNEAGPFAPEEPVMGGAGCRGATLKQIGQLTFCIKLA